LGKPFLDFLLELRLEDAGDVIRIPNIDDLPILARVALRSGGRRGWHGWESRRPSLRNELSTIPSSEPCHTRSATPVRVLTL
jgi:hypothetical protein